MQGLAFGKTGKRPSGKLSCSQGLATRNSFTAGDAENAEGSLLCGLCGLCGKTVFVVVVVATVAVVWVRATAEVFLVS